MTERPRDACSSWKFSHKKLCSRLYSIEIERILFF